MENREQLFIWLTVDMAPKCFFTSKLMQFMPHLKLLLPNKSLLFFTHLCSHTDVKIYKVVW